MYAFPTGGKKKKVHISLHCPFITCNYT